jgi:hypothetical protein
LRLRIVSLVAALAGMLVQKREEASWSPNVNTSPARFPVVRAGWS